MTPVLVLNHDLMFQLWKDPLFWEYVPSWEGDREEAEVLVEEAIEEQSSRRIQYSDLYNAWVGRLTWYANRDRSPVCEIVGYIRSKRKNNLEQIVLPRTDARRHLVILSDGVEPCSDASD